MINGYVDWVAAGAVTPVKNQKSCGSCWTFSATGALEGEHFIKTGNLVSFSEQLLIDCVYKRNGCWGGLQEDAFNYLETHYAETEDAYPYKFGTDRQDCQYDESKATNVETTSNGFTRFGSVS